MFGLVAERCSNFLLSDLLDKYQYSPFDISIIAKEVGGVSVVVLQKMLSFDA